MIATPTEYGLYAHNEAALLQAAAEVLASIAPTNPNRRSVQRALPAIPTWLSQTPPAPPRIRLSAQQHHTRLVDELL